MELFLYGLFIGIALGMWLAILLYTFAGRRRPGWSLFGRKKREAQPSAQAQEPDNDGPEDDFDEAYYAQHFPEQAGPTGAAATPAPAVVEERTVPAVVDGGAGNEEDVEEEDVEEEEGDEEPGADAGEQSAGKVQAAVVYTGASRNAGGEAYARLVDKMDGDVEATERLIEGERQRSPAAPRRTLIRNALDRLEYGPQ